MIVLRGSSARVRAAGIAAVAAISTALLSGCTTIVDGTAQRASGGPGAGEVDVSLLDTGNYPTKPAAALGPAGTPYKGGLLEAARMAENVVGPWEIDPTLTQRNATGAFIIKNVEALQLIQPDVVVKAMTGNDSFITAFASDRRDKNDKRLQNGVFRFRDAQSAADAAKTMSTAALDELKDSYEPRPVVPFPIPGHPDTLTTSYPFTPYMKTEGWSTIRAFTAHGPFVLVQLAEAPGGPEAPAALVAKAVDMQIPAIDKFAPTDADKIADLPRDPTGILARVIPLPDGDKTVRDEQTFGPHGLLHMQDDPIKSTKVVADYGIDAFVANKTNVYRTKDADAPPRVIEAFITELSAEDPAPKPAEGVNFMPASRCLEYPKTEAAGSGGFYCLAPAQNFVIEASSAQLVDVHQQVAAQYAMLLAK